MKASVENFNHGRMFRVAIEATGLDAVTNSWSHTTGMTTRLESDLLDESEAEAFAQSLVDAANTIFNEIRK